MSDFIADLERELLAAARRRATRRRRVVVLPRLRPATVLAVIALAALVVALVALARGLDDGSQPADERPELPPGPGVVLSLPAAPVAQPCPSVEQREVAGGVQHPLSVFDRPRTGADAVPELAGADSFSWIPAGTIHRVDARRVAPELFSAEAYLVPAAEPRDGGTCDGRLDAVLAVCLVVVDDETVVRCFSEDEVEGGRALAVTGRGMIHGITPNGVVSATVRWDGGAVTARVVDNAFEIAAPVEAGDGVRVELERAEACRPAPELLEVVPALRDGRWTRLPAVAEDEMPTGGKRQWARHLGGDEFDVWVVARCDDAERACVLAIHDAARVIAQPCGTAAEIRARGAHWLFPVAGRLGVAGVARPGTTRVEVVRDGSEVFEVPLTGGVFAAILPRDFGSSVDPGEGDMSDRLDIRFRDAP
jgi:hypothetical protein